MKLKILKNVVVGNRVQKAGAVVDVDRRTATALLDGEFAEEHNEAAAQQQQQPPPKE